MSFMDRSPQYVQGYRAASKDAVSWLHKTANEMSDPHARAVLNLAAFWFGQESKRKVLGDGTQEVEKQAAPTEDQGAV